MSKRRSRRKKWGRRVDEGTDALACGCCLADVLSATVVVGGFVVWRRRG